MFFYWLLIILAIAAVVVLLYADTTTRKKETSYFEIVQRPAGKKERETTILDFDEHDGFYAKLNG